MIKDKVAFLGPQGTFSHEAASLVSDNLISYCSIQQVMGAVESGECVCGIVPIENSIEGPVSLTLDSLIHNFDLKIKNEIVIPINHNLLAAKEAAKRVAETGEDAAIGTLKAAELYGLKVIDTNIQENFNNETRFVVLDNEDSPITGNDKTSISFSLFEDKPGGLYELLALFAENDVNLTKIESRPSKEGLGHYIFFIDLEGHRLDDDIGCILKHLEDNTSFFKVLGSYPVFSEDLFK